MVFAGTSQISQPYDGLLRWLPDWRAAMTAAATDAISASTAMIRETTTPVVTATPLRTTEHGIAIGQFREAGAADHRVT